MGLALAACSGAHHPRSVSSGPRPRSASTFASSTRFGPCQPLPAQAAAPDWYPADLPLPGGSYAAGEVPGPPSVRKGVWAVKASLRAFVQHTALEAWPARGWHLGRGDAEAGEADGNFRRGQEAGTFRARTVYCEQGWTELVVTFSAAAP